MTLDTVAIILYCHQTCLPCLRLMKKVGYWDVGKTLHSSLNLSMILLSSSKYLFVWGIYHHTTLKWFFLTKQVHLETSVWPQLAMQLLKVGRVCSCKCYDCAALQWKIIIIVIVIIEVVRAPEIISFHHWKRLSFCCFTLFLALLWLEKVYFIWWGLGIISSTVRIKLPSWLKEIWYLTHFAWVSFPLVARRTDVPSTSPPTHPPAPFPSLMWGCICPATPSAYAVLLPVSVGSQLLRPFVLLLLPAQPLCHHHTLTGGRNKCDDAPPAQLNHMQLCTAFVPLTLLHHYNTVLKLRHPPSLNCTLTPHTHGDSSGNKWKSILWSAEVDGVDPWLDLRFEPDF